MILIPHILTGAALGANFHHPYLLPLGALALHHLLDKVPHYDYQIKPFSSRVALKVFLDISIGILIVLFIYLFINPDINLTYAITGMFFGTLPDGLLLLSFIFKNKISEKYQKYHSFFHFTHPQINREEKKTFILTGLFTQIIAIIVALYHLL